MQRDLMAEHVKRFNGVSKPIIGCLHLRALPATPMYDPNYSIEQHIADLKREAHILMDLGFDGAVFANEADYPYVENIGPGALAAYTHIVSRVAEELTIPFGVGIMNDPVSAISVAKAVGATFVRGFFCGQQYGNYGPIIKTPGEIFRYAKSIGAENIGIYTSFEPHNGSSIDSRTFEEIAGSLYKDVPVAGYSLNGPKKGQAIEDSNIAICKKLYPNRSLDLEAFKADLDKNDELLTDVLGKYFSTRVIRCPGGHGSWKNMEPLDNYLEEKNMVSIDWNALNADAEGKRKNARELTEYAIKTSKGKEIVVLLMHDTYGKEETVKALPAIIKYFKDNGYAFKTLV